MNNDVAVLSDMYYYDAKVIRAKRRRGEKPAKPGDKDYPESKAWNKSVQSSQ